MDTGIELKSLRDVMELVPMEGEPNVFTIEFKDLPAPAGEEMTDAEWETYWDKFEKDIEDTCERIP